jgi:hypothetical protein
MSMPKIRATIIDILGIDRYEIIKLAITRFNTAIEHSFFLEAIALIELQKLIRQKTSKKEI